MALYLTRDMGESEDSGEVILWEVGEGDPPPVLCEDGHWFSDPAYQTLFPLTEHIAIKKGEIIRVYLTTTEPKHRTINKQRSNKANFATSAVR